MRLLPLLVVFLSFVCFVELAVGDVPASNALKRMSAAARGDSDSTAGASVASATSVSSASSASDSDFDSDSKSVSFNVESDPSCPQVPDNWQLCEGVCRNLYTDNRNCGYCDHECPSYYWDCIGGHCCDYGYGQAVLKCI